MLFAVACGGDDEGLGVADAALPDATPFVYEPSNVGDADFGAANGVLIVEVG